MRKNKNIKIKKKYRIYKRDFKYKSRIVTYFVNILMKNGKKNLSYNIFYNTLKIVKNKIKDEEPFKIFKKALNNIKPSVEIKARKIGSTTYNIPKKISKKKSIYYSIKWLILYSKKRKGISMSNKLAEEIIAAYNKIGESIKKKNEIDKLFNKNKGFYNFKN
ncbi:MAG: 30S ribosomal protein S7 [Flavobacteriales endosymbiont of Rhyzopertha dominica]|nr:MAG: 30S ribosomal protein S7 [Candidatus Shikimatogenerans bostrichidophilus]